MNYEWDEQKRIANLAKHGLDLAESWKVFEASTKVTFPATQVGPDEIRWFDIAEVEGLLLVLVYTMRGDSVRSISFRRAKRKERRAYDAALEDR